MGRNGGKGHKRAKKERHQDPADSSWSINDLLYGNRALFTWGAQQVVPSEQDWLLLPAHQAIHTK